MVPFGYFAPQPVAGIAGLLTIVFQGVLIVERQSLVAELADDRALHSDARRSVPVVAAGSPPPLTSRHPCIAAHLCARRCRRRAERRADAEHAVAVPGDEHVVRAIHLVNTYGAFGSITRTRYEIVIEGTDDRGRRATRPRGASTSSRESLAIRHDGRRRSRRTICGSTG